MKTIHYVAMGLLGLLTINAWTSPATVKTVSINKETAATIINIKYPQGFKNKSIDQAVIKLVDNAQQSFAKPDPSAEKLPNDLPGKNSLNIDYKIMYQDKKAVSIFFSLSMFTRGAAHPANSIEILNFIDGKPVSLSDLFKPDSSYLTKIADHARTVLQKRDLNSDKTWLNDGTKAVASNYKNWYFTPFGISIVFDTYQVAAYVYGPQTVEISKAQFKSWLRPSVAAMVWSS